MAAKKQIAARDVREFVVRNVENHPRDIAKMLADHFAVSRQAANARLRGLMDEGLITAEGKTKARVYTLKTLASKEYMIDANAKIDEGKEWRDEILPLMNGIPDNVKDICQYGFTEILNNVFSHSNAAHCCIGFYRDASKIKIVIDDDGVGIFYKIQNELGLEDARHSILELSKGKLTTDPEKHTGEGIFFSSRSFDEFDIFSGEFTFLSEKEDDAWLLDIGNGDRQPVQGTVVLMKISVFANQTLREIIRRYEDDDARFSRTHVPLRLAKYEGEKLISRSQARRLLVRIDRFNEAILDFRGIDEIGQAFADEIFRVFANEHPHIKIFVLHTSPVVDRMINHVQRGTESQQQSFKFQ